VKEKIVNIMGLLLPSIFFLLLTGSLIRSLKKHVQTEDLVKRTWDKIEKAKKDNEELEKQLKFVESEKYIEEQIRNKLGMVKEGEIVLVLPDKETLKKLAPNMPEEKDFKPLPNWKKWMNLFL